MTTQAVENLSPQNGSAHRNGIESPVESVVIRLDNMPATDENRLRILECVRRLNGVLEESGTPFRLRLL
jgi:hypothetical protein